VRGSLNKATPESGSEMITRLMQIRLTDGSCRRHRGSMRVYEVVARELMHALNDSNFKVPITMLSWEEVGKHNSRESCWVVIRGEAYDVTAFVDDHPGGAKSLLRYGGKDGTEEYESLHPLGTIEKTLSPGMNIDQPVSVFDQKNRPAPRSR
jgi:cytochrome b involved in lipid metabolism